MNNNINTDKRIAIINRFPNEYVGGIEIYLTVLIEGLIEEGYKVDFLYWKTDKQMSRKSKHDSLKSTDVNYVQLYGNRLFPQRKLIKYVEKKLKEKFYDIVINNNWNIASKYLQNSNRVIRVQHNDWKRHDPSNRKIINKIGHKFGSIIGIDITGNVLDDSHNTVFFSKYTNVMNTAKNVFYIPTPISSDFKAQITTPSSSKKRALWFNRLNDVEHKGISNLIKIANSYDALDIIGVDPIPEIKSHKSYKGIVKRDDLYNVLNKYKIFCMTSNFEGYPIVALEALSSGIPIVLFNTFDSLQEWVEAGVAFSVEPNNIEAYKKKMDMLLNMDDDEYKALSSKCFEHSKRYYPNVFKEKWKKVIKDVINNTVSKDV